MKRVISAILAVGLAAASPAWAAHIDIEAEEFTDSHDIAYDSIRAVDAPSCSGGFMLVGLDYPDEWTEYTFAPISFGYFSVQMKARGDFGVFYRLRLTLTGDNSGQSQSVDITFTGRDYG